MRMRTNESFVAAGLLPGLRRRTRVHENRAFQESGDTQACVCAQIMHPRSGKRLGCSQDPRRRTRMHESSLVKYHA